MKIQLFKSIVVSLIFSISNFANAGLLNVSTIEISSAVSNIVQVSEVIVWNNNSSGGGSDIGLTSAGATATATGFYQGDISCNSATEDASCVLDGLPTKSWPNIYHSYGSSDVLTITLIRPSEIEWFQIFGRDDSGNSARDVYNVSFFDKNGNELYKVESLNAWNVLHMGQIDLPNNCIIVL